MANLLDNAAATGEWIIVGHGSFILRVDGTFAGATLQLQMQSPDGISELDILDATFTARGACVVSLANGVPVRMAVSGGTPSALYADLRVI